MLSDSVGGIAARRFGTRAVVIVGAVVTAATMIALAALHTAEWQLVLAKVLTAFAAGIGSTALLASTATAVEAKDTGIATSLLVVTRVIGAALGAQIAGAILDAGTDPVDGPAGRIGLRHSFRRRRPRRRVVTARCPYHHERREPRHDVLPVCRRT